MVPELPRTGIYLIENRPDHVTYRWTPIAPGPCASVDTDGRSVIGVVGDDDWTLLTVTNLVAAGYQPPILVIRRSLGSEGAVALLDAGADYCVAHCCPGEEIDAVLGALSRRGRLRHATADVEINEANRSISVKGEPFEFGPVAFLVVRYLVQKRGQWVSQKELVEKAIGTYYRPDSAVARVQVFQIRKTLGHRRNLIRHAGKRGCGYMFVANSAEERASEALSVGAAQCVREIQLSKGDR